MQKQSRFRWVGVMAASALALVPVSVSAAETPSGVALSVSAADQQEYSDTQLARWRDQLSVAVLGWYATGYWFDEIERKVNVGVVAPKLYEDRVRDVVDDLGIPQDVVEVPRADPAFDDGRDPNYPFDDVRTFDEGTHVDNVNWAYYWGIVDGFDDNTFRPTSPVTRGQLASMLNHALPISIAADPGFSDVGLGSAHGRAVANAHGAGILEGYGDGSFGVREPVTRAQMASMLDRAIEFDRADGVPFSDVPSGSTHAQAIGNLAAAEVIVGYRGGTFQPQSPVTREEAATLLFRAMTY